MSPEQAKEKINQFSNFEVGTIKLLGSGADSVAFLVNDEWVFRFPVVKRAQATLTREISLLPKLTSTMSTAVPEFKYVGRRGSDLLFVGYRKLIGEPLTMEQFDKLETTEQEAILKSLASFLQQLHSFSVDAARDAGVKEELYSGAYNPGQKSLISKISHLLSASEVNKLEKILASYESSRRNFANAPALLHSDIKPRHVMYDQPTGKFGGIIDWGDACLGDPDFDFTCLYVFFSPEFVHRLLQYFPDRRPDIILKKIQFFITLRWLQDAAYSVVERGNSDGIERLRHRLMEYSNEQ